MKNKLNYFLSIVLTFLSFLTHQSFAGGIDPLYIYSDSNYNPEIYEFVLNYPELFENFKIEKYMLNHEKLLRHINSNANTSFLVSSNQGFLKSKTCSVGDGFLNLDTCKVLFKNINEICLYRNGRDLRWSLEEFLIPFLLMTAIGYIFEAVEYPFNKNFNFWVSPSLGAVTGLTISTICYFSRDPDEFDYRTIKFRMKPWGPIRR